MLSRWRKEAQKKKDRVRKRKEKQRKKEHPHGGVARKNNKGIAICSMMKAAKPNHPTTEKDAMRNYITQHVPGTHLTFEHISFGGKKRQIGIGGTSYLLFD